MNIKYFVRTTGYRKLDQSYEQIDYKILCYNTGNPIDDFIQSLYDISNYNSVLLEDDLILCKNFDTEIKNVLDKYPNRIINFFENPLFPVDITESTSIIFNQCTFYPKDMAKKIADKMITKPRVSDVNRDSYNRYSILESTALKELNEKVVHYRPHLVQHLDLDTNISKKSYHMYRSNYFIDYFTKLGITYADTEKYSHKLFLEMRSHFKEITQNKEKYFK